MLTRNALVFDFTTTPSGLGIGHFGVNLLDVESSASFTSAELRVYSAGLFVFSQAINYPSGDGDGEEHFVGVVGETVSFFDQVMIVVGDDNAGGGNTEHLAAHKMWFGQGAALAPVPIPAALPLLLTGLAGLCLIGWRRRKAA